jgi:hypothetical protein
MYLHVFLDSFTTMQVSKLYRYDLYIPYDPQNEK